MGRQSSRLYFTGKDHKEIYFQRKYHNAMYLGSELLWEKLSDLVAVLNFPVTGYLAHDENYVYLSYWEDIWKINRSDWQDNSFLENSGENVVAADCINGLSAFFTKDAYFIKNEGEACICVPSKYPSDIEKLTGYDTCIVGSDIYGVSRIKQNRQHRLLLSTINGSYRVCTQYGYYGHPRLCRMGNSCFVGCYVAESIDAETGEFILLKYSNGIFSEIWKKSIDDVYININCMLQVKQIIFVATGHETANVPPTLYYIGIDGTEIKAESLKEGGRVLALTYGNGYIVGVFAFYNGYSFINSCVMYKKIDDAEWKYKDLGDKRQKLKEVNYLKDNLFIFSVEDLRSADGGYIIAPIE